MIDITNLQDYGSTSVEACDAIFPELGRNTYDFKDLISELIDNAIAARRREVRLVVNITILVDSDNEAQKFVISDNASGIPQEELGSAIAPAGVQSSDSLNEHGLGMKQAVPAIGRLEYLATKTPAEENARVIKQFHFGDVPTFQVEFGADAGTEISIVDLNPIVQTNPTVISRSLQHYLGARYRRFLRPDNKQLDLRLWIAKDESGETLNSWDVQEVKPIYFHPSTRTNRPVIDRYELSGDEWCAELTFGYAPDEDTEWAELGLEPPTKFHPYYVSLSKQGLDLIRHDRVILFHQLSELRIVDTRHGDYNPARGEIDLISGFSTAITKNSIIPDRHFEQLIDQVRAVLQGKREGPGGETKNYLQRKTYPDEIPEKLLRDRLAEYLRTNPLSQREQVSPEYVVEGIEGYIDIRADEEAWEIKTGQARAYDVYQLFMYMDVGDIDMGFLVAKEFSPGANIASRHIAEHHEKTIQLTTLSDFPILHDPDPTEREEYY